ncbi:hypothetical protein C8N28_0317 [Albibacterium bauzanense]|uniref:LPXTG-motif cell wall-anchored protein n=2 Tax=Albibacterium bauzanense TaxID=653929 RepID=A0A4V2PY85_9SPHI|nr:hypothetical protein C8N28_0317 [Albibacterium bauzanense]
MLMKTFGIILTILGIVMLIWTGFSYTKQEKVVDIGPLEVNADKEKQVNWPSYTGGILLVAGVVLILVDKKKV